MAFRINHIHLKAPDPRTTAEWYVRAFNFKIMSDETRVFGDRFIRCQSEDGGMGVNISGARTGERLGPGDASAHPGSSTSGSTPRTSRPTSSGSRAWAPACWRGPSRSRTGRASRSCGRPTTSGSS